MSDVGRKRWWRAATIAVLGGGSILGGWAGLSRSAPPADAAWVAAPPSVEPGVDKEASPPPAPAPQLPAIPVIPAIPPADVTPVAAPPTVPAMPVIPAATPVLPPVPAVSVKPPETSIPPIAPVVPVLLPPSIETSVPAATDQPRPPSPTNPARPDQLPNAAKPVSRLQDANVGNTVIMDKPAANPTRSEPPAFPALDPVIPVLPPPGTNPVVPPVRKPDEVTGIPVDRVKPNTATPDHSEKDVFPIPNLTAPTPGDTTVRSLNQSVAAAILGGVLFAQSSPASAAPLTFPARIAADEKTDLAELKTKVETATTKLNDIQKDLKQLTELLNGRRDKDGIPDGTSRGLLADLKDINDRLKKVEEDLTKMRGQSSSLRPSAPTGGTVDPRAGKGTVRIVNEYPIQVSLVVNGTSYQVAPSKSLDVDVPSGEFTYQLLQSGAAATKSAIKEKETVTLRIK